MLTPDQEQRFRDHLRAVDARETCPSCDAGRYTVEASPPWIARICAQCGAVLLYDPRPLGMDVRWTLGPEGTEAIAAKPAAPIHQKVRIDDEGVTCWPDVITAAELQERKVARLNSPSAEIPPPHPRS